MRRYDLQFIRAFAIVAVLLSHFFPAVFPGGFIGVDIFLFLSGYLFYGGVQRILDVSTSKTTVIAFVKFIVKRVRRIVPVALITLGVSAIAVYKFLIVSRYIPLSEDIRASVLFYQNFHLADKAVDYFSLDDVVSPFQHFWYLATLEQVILLLMIISLLAGLCGYISKISKVSKYIFVGVVACLGITSFIYSIIHTKENSTGAYFICTTRAWEVIFGLLFAFAIKKIRIQYKDQIKTNLYTKIAIVLTTISIIILCLLVLCVDGSKYAFPGAWALVPVACVAVIVSVQFEPKWMNPLPVRFVSDISFSLYLIHFPLLQIVIQSQRVEDNFTTRLILLAISFVMACIGKFIFEDFFNSKKMPDLVAIILVGILLVGVLFACSKLDNSFNKKTFTAKKQYAKLLKELKENPYKCLGANTVQNCDFHGSNDVKKIIPSPAIIYGTNSPTCWHEKKEKEAICKHIKGHSKTIALLGDSHASMWYESINFLAHKRKMNFTEYTTESCLLVPNSNVGSTNFRESCKNNRPLQIENIKKQCPNVLLMISAAYNASHLNDNEYNDQIEKTVNTYKDIATCDTQMVVIRDTPTFKKSDLLPRECLQYKSASECVISKEDAIVRDVNVDAAMQYNSQITESNKKIRVLDFNNIICPNAQNVQTKCSSVQGGINIFADQTHMSKAYILTLTPYLEKQLFGF